MDENLWCPTSNYKAGFCCSGIDGIPNCPRATACSDDFDIPELQYMTCPNEDSGCVYDRNLKPPPDGSVEVYEKLTGQFFERDVCTFIIENPSGSDFNDIMYLRMEYFENCFPVLIKGESLFNPVSMYQLEIGQTYTALKGTNFYLLFQATTESRGKFIFSLWHQTTDGIGERESNIITYEEDPRIIEEPEPKPETELDADAETETEGNNDDDEDSDETRTSISFPSIDASDSSDPLQTEIVVTEEGDDS